MDYQLCSATETQNAKNIIALAKLLCQKGILQESEIDQIFSTKSNAAPTSFTGNFPLNLLHQGVESNGNTPELIEDGKRRINAIMQKFAIPGEIVDCISNPHFTNYKIALAPEENTDVFRLIKDEICSTLNSRSVRILPSTDDHIFIEVPNTSFPQLHIRQLLESEEWKNSKAEIPLAIGKNTFGEPVILDLDKAPHILIADTIGTGKNICTDSLIMSMLYHFRPDELRLIMFDPAIVKFDAYKKLPHLLTSIINDSSKVPAALRWAADEINRRHHILAQAGMKELAEFNCRPIQNKPEFDKSGNLIPTKMPLIVIILDELADLMMSEAKKDIENNITRIAQKGHTVGIHIIVTTRYPSTNVITGVIKVNFPTRLCFQVRSLVDSRVVLDAPGAENLSEEGDMLMTATGGCHPTRINVASTTRSDMKKVIDFIREQYGTKK